MGSELAYELRSQNTDQCNYDKTRSIARNLGRWPALKVNEEISSFRRKRGDWLHTIRVNFQHEKVREQNFEGASLGQARELPGECMSASLGHERPRANATDRSDSILSFIVLRLT